MGSGKGQVSCNDWLVLAVAHQFLDLPTQTQADIADVIADLKGVDVIAVEERLKRDNPELRVARVPIPYIQVDTEYRVNLHNVMDYAKLPEVKSPPIIMAGPKLHDGGHRILAALIRGEGQIRRVNIAPLLEWDWSAG